MRKDMAKVIVTRARILEDAARKGGASRTKSNPSPLGSVARCASVAVSKLLNENLVPLRRYLDAQLGRP